MRTKTLLAALAASLLAASAGPAGAKTFRFAFQGNYQALDPYTLNETFTLGMHAAAYEALTRRDKDLNIIPGLAEQWETVDPLRWRFHLRKGVKFHNGNPFTADDVLFSAQRVRAGGSHDPNRGARIGLNPVPFPPGHEVARRNAMSVVPPCVRNGCWFTRMCGAVRC